MPTETIAIIHDDAALSRDWINAIKSPSRIIRPYNDQTSVLRALTTPSVDIAIIAFDMARINPIHIAEKIQNSSATPIIMIGKNTTEDDQLSAFNAGAADIIVYKDKLSQSILYERVNALLRRTAPRQIAATKKQHPTATIQRGDLFLNRNSYLCTWKGQRVPLSKTEFDIMCALAQSVGHKFNQSDLTRLTGKHPGDIPSAQNPVNHHVKRMRRKFETIDTSFDGIQNDYNQGYYINPDMAPSEKKLTKQRNQQLSAQL